MMPLSFHLTRSEEKLLHFLMSQAKPSKPMMMDHLYQSVDDEPGMKILDVMIFRIRRKLAPFGVKIRTHWGRGYYLLPPDKAIIRTYIEAENELLAEATA